LTVLDGWPQRLSVLAAGLVAFSILHSLLASDDARAWAERRLGLSGRMYRLAYNSIAAGLLLWTWISTRGEYPFAWRLAGWPRAGLLVVQALAFVGFVLTVRQFDVPAFLGLRGTPGRGVQAGLQTRGMYALCRHPLYLTTALFFSTRPMMDLRWLAVAGWLWLYASIGSIFEERRLLREYGDAYRLYQATHLRLLPLGPRSKAIH
jgi:protein-S-isoprenylcysteine O-methyltransferase Ste14